MLLFCAFGLCAQGQLALPTNAPSGLRVISDFPGGSAKVVSIDQTNAVIRISPAGNPDRGFVCWWYFKVEGVEVGTSLTLEVSASGWGRPDQAQFSYDNRTWNQTAPGEQKARNLTAYHLQVASNEVWIAWGPPFLLQDATNLISETCRSSPYATSFELARTREGRIVPAMKISQPGVADKGRYGIWVQARQHAWESGSSWVGRGFVEWLVSNDPAAEALRKKADIYFVPIMDVDNVELGNGGKNQKPHDQYWDWGTSPYFPEVQAAIERISALESGGRFDLFMDLHDPGAQDRNILFYTPAQPLLVAERLTNQNYFLKIAQEEMTGPISFIGQLGPAGATYDPVKDPASDCWIAHNCRPHVVALVLETPWNTPASTQAGYLKTGEQLGRCIEQYLRTSIRSPAGK